ncbi:FGGY-family carbohydrate kinase [bacterium]|nr:FGGY-family carbohydrate kinase [bacterium]
MIEHKDEKTSIPRSNRYVVVIDLGSTGIKAAVVSDSGDVISSAYEKIDVHLLENEGAEQDADQWWNNSKAAAKRAIQESGVSPDNIVAVCCDSQYSVIVPVDEQARPLMRAVHWLDKRGGIHNRKISKGLINIEGYGLTKIIRWLKISGLAPTSSGIDSLGHMLVIKNEFPDIYRKTYKFLEPMDFLTAQLTGRITATQHSVSLMMVASNQKWDTQEYSNTLLKLAGIDKEKLPDLIPNGSVVGPLLPSVAEELGLRASTQVVSGLFDNHAAAIGSGIVDNYECLLIVATTLSLNGHVPFKKTDINTSIVSVPGCLKDKYMLICEQGLGGKCLEFYLSNIVCHEDEFCFGPMPDDAYERLNRIAEKVPPGSGNVLFLPWLNGSVTPKLNGSARGGFFNLSLNSSRSHLTRAIMEGVAFDSRSAIKPLEKFMGKKIEKLRFAGGGALSDVWAQIYADVTGIPIHQIADPVNATCRGAALQGLATLRYLKLEDIPGLVKVKQVFEPIKSNQKIYEKLFKQFRAILDNNKKVYDALNS